MTIAGRIAGDVQAQAESIHLTDGATVTGDLRYSGENVATIDDGAVVMVGELPADRELAGRRTISTASRQP